MSLIKCSECGKDFSDKAISCPNCGCPTETNITTQSVKKDNSTDSFSKEKVIEHLTHVAFLEKTIFAYKTAYENIENQISSLGNKNNYEKPQPINVLETFQMCTWIILPAFLISAVILCLTGGHFWSDLICLLTVVLALFNGELMGRLFAALGIAILIAFAVFLVAIFVQYKNYSEEKELYENNVKNDERRVDRELDYIGELFNQQNEITERCEECEKLLNRLYSLNIIYPTYRNMVAILTILEYFKSGRCNSLTGAHGAYDTFSYEEKQNLIISKLDTVIYMLDDIRNSQYLLYDAISTANALSQSICDQNERMIETGNEIKENTKLIAYNTDIIKQNTTISAYIDVFSM